MLPFSLAMADYRYGTWIYHPVIIRGKEGKVDQITNEFDQRRFIKFIARKIHEDPLEMVDFQGNHV
jgi:hypothetical protein